MRRLLLGILGIALFALPSAARVRSVHHSAAPCTFAIAPTWGSATVPSTGLSRGVVLVFGQTPECAQWSAYSTVNWALVEPAPVPAQPAALVSVEPNPTSAPRSTVLIIAGLRLTLTQDGVSTVSPPVVPNLIVNGTFDRDVSSWGWFARYPNAPGTPQWSQFDANGSAASGSMLLRDGDFDFRQSFQQLQCVRIDSQGVYEFGAKLRTGGADGAGAIAFLTYRSADCSGNYVIRDVHEPLRPEPGVWTRYDFTSTVFLEERSAILLFASAGEVAPFETWWDDAYLRKK